MMSSWLGSVKSTSQRLTIKESLFNQIAAVVFGGHPHPSNTTSSRLYSDCVIIEEKII